MSITRIISSAKLNAINIETGERFQHIVQGQLRD
jgi:hypothetical protein